MQDEGSVTRWVDQFKHGESKAASHLWDRYYQRLVAIARAKTRRSLKNGVVEDEEDAALSALDTFFRGLQEGKFPGILNRNELWKILVILTVRKTIDQYERRAAKKRNGALEDFHPENLVSKQDDPELTIALAEEQQRARSLLHESMQRIFDLRLEGHSREEIATRLGIAVRTVTRKLQIIREILQNELTR